MQYFSRFFNTKVNTVYLLVYPAEFYIIPGGFPCLTGGKHAWACWTIKFYPSELSITHRVTETGGII